MNPNPPEPEEVQPASGMYALGSLERFEDPTIDHTHGYVAIGNPMKIIQFVAPAEFFDWYSHVLLIKFLIASINEHLYGEQYLEAPQKNWMTYVMRFVRQFGSSMAPIDIFPHCP